LEVFLGRAEQELNKSNCVQWKVTADLERAAVIAPNDPRLRSLRTKATSEADRIAAEKANAKGIFAERPLVNSINLSLKKLPAGKFVMGEGPDAHEVTLTRPFYLGVYEVTHAQYEQVMGVTPTPSYLRATQNPVDNNPVEKVSWKEATEFCRKLSELPEEKAAGRVYRLPTEAEWEYACRAGTTTNFSSGDDQSTHGDYAWFVSNSGAKPHPVGEKKPNAWGLFDMNGNVEEWCSDWYGDYSKGAVTDPTGPTTGSYRVVRGGSWDGGAADCRSAFRGRIGPSIRDYGLGFRIALSPSGIQK
jgi:formylglycine-generating enzyme required for sulfatase activity